MFIIATTTSSITLNFKVIGLMMITIMTGMECGISVGNEILYEVIVNEYNIHKKQYGKDQKTNESLDKLYRKSLEDIVFDKNDHESLSKKPIKYLDKMKKEFFSINMNIETKFNFFGNKKLKFNLDHRSYYLFCLCLILINSEKF